MVSGIAEFLKELNPKTLYLKIRRHFDLKKYKGKNILLPLNYSIINSTLGQDVKINNNVSFKNSSIDNFSYINSNSSINRARIGKFCSIGPNVQIGLGSHPTDLVSTNPRFYANNKKFKTFSTKMSFEEYKDTLIENDVWLSEGVLIVGGIKIGNGAVVLPRSVVTKDIEPYSIVGGIPAKHIKYRFDEEVILRIQETEWWNWEEEEFVREVDVFNDIDKFIDYIERRNKLI